jgi:hypothetical protein
MTLHQFCEGVLVAISDKGAEQMLVSWQRRLPRAITARDLLGNEAGWYGSHVSTFNE